MMAHHKRPTSPLQVLFFLLLGLLLLLACLAPCPTTAQDNAALEERKELALQYARGEIEQLTGGGEGVTVELRHETQSIAALDLDGVHVTELSYYDAGRGEIGEGWSYSVRIIGPLPPSLQERVEGKLAEPASSPTEKSTLQSSWGMPVVETFTPGKQSPFDDNPFVPEASWTWSYWDDQGYAAIVYASAEFDSGQGRALIAPIAEATHRGIVEYLLGWEVTAPAVSPSPVVDRVKIVVNSTRVEGETLIASGLVSSLSPIVSATFYRQEPGDPLQGHITIAANGSFTAECPFVPGQTNIFKIVADNEAELSAEQTLTVSGQGTPIGETTTGESGDTTVPVLPGLGQAGPVPGPQNAGQAAAGLVIPGLVSIVLSLLSGLGRPRPQTPPPQAPPRKPAPQKRPAPSDRKDSQERAEQERLRKEQARREKQAEQDRLEQEREQAHSFAGSLGSTAADFANNVKEDLGALPGQARDAARAASDVIGNAINETYQEVTDRTNWTALGDASVQTVKDVLDSPVESTKKVFGFYSNVGAGLLDAVWNVVSDPIGLLKTLLGIDNWSKVIDPKVPVGERVVRYLYGVFDIAVKYKALKTAKEALQAVRQGKRLLGPTVRGRAPSAPKRAPRLAPAPARPTRPQTPGMPKPPAQPATPKAPGAAQPPARAPKKPARKPAPPKPSPDNVELQEHAPGDASSHDAADTSLEAIRRAQQYRFVKITPSGRIEVMPYTAGIEDRADALLPLNKRLHEFTLKDIIVQTDDPRRAERIRRIIWRNIERSRQG